MQLTCKEEEWCGQSGGERCVLERDGLWQREVQFELMYNACQYFYYLECKCFADTTNKTALNCGRPASSCSPIRQRFFHLQCSWVFP